MQQQRNMGTPCQPMGRYPNQPSTTPQSTMRRPGGPQLPSQATTMQANRVSQPLRKKKRYADKLISPQVRELVPESQAYMDLLAFEQKLDATITRKKLDIQEALKRPQKVKKRLRIYISHTFIAGKEPEKLWMFQEGEEGSVPMWELRVEGRLIEDQTNGSTTVGHSNPAPPARPLPKKKFSSFFKSLVIELDKDIYGPDNHLVEWHRTPTTNETDGFQVKRPGDRPVKCTILLLLDYQPMKFKLHPRLAKVVLPCFFDLFLMCSQSHFQVLGIAAETRPKIIEALWQYIKTHKLQDPVDHDTVNNDTFLEQVFSCKRMRFMEIPQRLHQLLQQPDPLVLSHIIKHNEGGAEKNTACYDIDVEVEDPLKQHMAAFVHTQANVQDIANLDQKIYDVVDQINEWKTRRDFYVRFADHPHEFIRKWLVSQSQDLKTMTEASGEGEAERRADHYYRPETQEGVFRYIYQKVQQKRAELEQGLGVRNN
ncbi:SWIB/MDM2 domain protein [Dictyocaulus viviparus]|uniref:SWIB/MDM2 domain protein n=1 Tax=Dictyocaulus viviparus TaxID=29172 RepID=A0A0D8Y878_DICVI|nr:SWIB/MDM2 domain protein [Dictyocaulus viviparus]